jgi:hypothetical protein
MNFQVFYRRWEISFFSLVSSSRCRSRHLNILLALALMRILNVLLWRFEVLSLLTFGLFYFLLPRIGNLMLVNNGIALLAVLVSEGVKRLGFLLVVFDRFGLLIGYLLCGKVCNGRCLILLESLKGLSS